MPNGHVLVKTPDGLFSTTYHFLTQNKEVGFIQYEFKVKQLDILRPLPCTDVKLIKDNPDFEAFLREQTFERRMSLKMAIRSPIAARLFLWR